ncbi:hypothetical protein H6P81_015844 [Aristolochia fimbriata]|uniref:Uncharacterized protein n=1 Tax=Aristolochia fimbriata TaxID=158543 RepID=A0AAV7E8F7_ARIFI|nr:hypothetical protein H6P81_015844 [Aristolochia fimbriata]
MSYTVAIRSEAKSDGTEIDGDGRAWPHRNGRWDRTRFLNTSRVTNERQFGFRAGSPSPPCGFLEAGWLVLIGPGPKAPLSSHQSATTVAISECEAANGYWLAASSRSPGVCRNVGWVEDYIELSRTQISDRAQKYSNVVKLKRGLPETAIKQRAFRPIDHGFYESQDWWRSKGSCPTRTSRRGTPLNLAENFGRSRDSLPWLRILGNLQLLRFAPPCIDISGKRPSTPSPSSNFLSVAEKGEAEMRNEERRKQKTMTTLPLLHPIS